VRSPPVLVTTFAFLVLVHPLVGADEPCGKQFVVSQINSQISTHLSPSAPAAIRAGFIGECFDSQQVVELAKRVRKTLLGFGYLRPSVSESSLAITDPSMVRLRVPLKIRSRKVFNRESRGSRSLGTRIVSLTRRSS
jgi:hypothetical protein